MRLTAIAEERDEGRRVKHFIRGTMRVSYGQYTSLKARDGIKVNGIPVHANFILSRGDTVEVTIAEEHTSIVEPVPGRVSIVYEDEDLIVIDKDAPLACQSSSRNPEPALENYLVARYGTGFVFRPLSRLDRGTSGLLCAAFNPHAAQLLQKQLHTEAYVREYLAVVCGDMRGSGTIDLPIAKADAATVRRVIDPINGKASVTHWRAIESGSRYSLVRLQLGTGRTHQIRVHMSAVGHPVAGDFLYGTELPGLKERFALHSAYLSMVHPISGERLSFESPIPAELEKLLR